jgi:hypothetical protein
MTKPRRPRNRRIINRKITKMICVFFFVSLQQSLRVFASLRGFDYGTPNASKTFPGRPPNAPYPELTNTMPPATTGPGPIIDAPRPATPLTVVNSRFVSNSQRIAPSLVEYTRNAPSFDPEKTAPGITVTAADCAALHPRPVPHAGGRGGASHAR